MKLSIGIVGLPNVGKSTLFNSLTNQKVLIANYPFATIDPNHGVVPLKDERLEEIVVIQNPKNVVRATVEFVDIAGIVKGASTGAGLGNQFLNNIRETTAIVHVVRAFLDNDITHVENGVDPRRDIELINFELILKDIDSVSKKLTNLKSQAKLNKKLANAVEYFQEFLIFLEKGNLGYDFHKSTDEETLLLRKELFLLTDKETIYVVNCDIEKESEANAKISEIVGKDKTVVAFNFKQEAELALLDTLERKEFMDEFGILQSGLELIVREAYKKLGVISFFTSGPSESRAWTIFKGETAHMASAVIHTDIQKNFIVAEIVSCADFIQFKGWNGAKEAGKVRLEGKNYIVADGDVILFRHNG